MVRVTFIAGPFKRLMVKSMIEHFSPRVVSQIVTPDYPLNPTTRDQSVLGKLDAILLGGRRLRESVFRFEPDVVYADAPIYGAQLKLLSTFTKRRVPLILHLRGDWWREHRSSVAQASWRARAVLTQQLAYNWWSVCAARKITPICRWLEGVVKHYAPTSRTEVVYQGVDPNKFVEADKMDLNKPAVAIIQNHSIDQKVCGLLMFREVVLRMPDVYFYISKGETSGQRFLSLIQSHYSSLPNVQFVDGIVTPNMVRAMLGGSDCYVLASGLDCCPTTILEASLMERPVVASRIGGVPEIVVEGKTGWTIPNGLVDQWVARLRKVLDDSRLKRSMGQSGREWVSGNFGWNVIAKQVERLLLEEVA